MLNIRSIGIFFLLGYAAYNVVNILYIYEAVSTINFLIAMASLYLVSRFLRMFSGNGEISQAEIIGILLLLLVGVVVLIQHIVHEPFVSGDGIEVVSTISTLTQISLLWFLIGGACANYEIKSSDTIAVILSLFVALSMFFATDDNLTIPFSTIKAEAGIEGVSHLILEKHVIFLLVFSFSLAVRMKYVCVGLALCALFFMGGRTSLFAFLVVSVLLMVRGNVLKNVFAISVATVIAVMIFQYAVYSGFIDLESAAVREILFLEGVEEDSSFQGRAELYKSSMPLLADQIWIGNYSLAVQRTGYFSGYIHNLLSAWQFYGFFVFLALIVCLSYCVRRMYFAFKNHERPSDVFGGFILVYVILSVVLAKYAAWHLLWFSLGFWLLREPVRGSVKARRKRRKRRVVRDSINGWDAV